MSASDDALALHRDVMVIDTHNDTIVSHIRRGNLALTGTGKAGVPDGTVSYLRGPLYGPPAEIDIQINVPLMREGGIDAAFFAVDCTRAWKNNLAYALDALGVLVAQIDAIDDLVIALSADDIRSARDAGKLAVVLAVENSDCTEGSLNILCMLHRVGVRSIGLTHNISSWAADGNAETRSRGGLTSFGVDLVREMNRLGMVVDVAHISEPGFWDVLEVAERPVMVTHTTCKAICDHPRNLSDEQIKALGENGGTMGMTFVPAFVDESAPTLERYLDHIDHAVQLVGPRHVGLGSDFDGGGTLMRSAADFPLVTDGLLRRGYSEDDLRLILGENHLRVFEACCSG